MPTTDKTEKLLDPLQRLAISAYENKRLGIVLNHIASGADDTTLPSQEEQRLDPNRLVSTENSTRAHVSQHIPAGAEGSNAVDPQPEAVTCVPALAETIPTKLLKTMQVTPRCGVCGCPAYKLTGPTKEVELTGPNSSTVKDCRLGGNNDMASVALSKTGRVLNDAQGRLPVLTPQDVVYVMCLACADGAMRVTARLSGHNISDMPEDGSLHKSHVIASLKGASAKNWAVMAPSVGQLVQVSEQARGLVPEIVIEIGGVAESLREPHFKTDTKWRKFSTISHKSAGADSSLDAPQTLPEFVHVTMAKYYQSHKTAIQDVLRDSGLSHKERSFGAFMSLLSHHLNTDKVPYADRWADDDFVSSAPSDLVLATRKDRFKAVASSAEMTLATAAQHLMLQTADFTMEQQIYISKHLDYIVMVVGDGQSPGSLGQPYWCLNCCWVPLAIGSWTHVQKSNGQGKWFCVFCGCEFHHNRTKDFIPMATAQGWEIPSELAGKEFPYLAIYRGAVTSGNEEHSGIEIRLSERPGTEAQRGIDVLKLLTQTPLLHMCRSRKGPLSDGDLYETMMHAILSSDGRFGQLVADLPKRMLPVQLPKHTYGGAVVKFLGKKRSMDIGSLERGESRLAFKIDPIKLLQDGLHLGDKEYLLIVASLRFVLNPENVAQALDHLVQTGLAGDDHAPPRIRRGAQVVRRLMTEPWQTFAHQG